MTEQKILWQLPKHLRPEQIKFRSEYKSLKNSDFVMPNIVPVTGVSHEKINRIFGSLRDKVNAAEDIMRQMPQVEIEPKHYFAKGIYAREIFIPKGVTLTGKIHKYSQLNIMSKGDMSVLTEDGIKRVQAPFTIVSPPGTKRIAHAHEDTVWTTIHGTDEINLDRIEQQFIAQSEEEYLLFCIEQEKQLKLDLK